MIPLLEKILSQMKMIHKPQKKFIQILFQAMLASHGKLNFRNLSRYSLVSEKTISRNYRKDFEFPELNKLLLKEMGFETQRNIAVFDPSFIKKSGKKTHGLGKFWNGSNSRAEKGLEIGCVGVVNIDTKDCLVVSANQTEPIANENGNRIDRYIEHISKSFPYFLNNTEHISVDGFFYIGRFVKAMINLGLHVVGRLRSDAQLLVLYSGPKNKRKGRPRKYIGKFDKNDINQYTDGVTLQDGTRLLGAIVYSKALEQTIKIASIYNASGNKRLATFFSTDLKLSVKDIYRFYRARYQIEFCFRDAKQHTGLLDCQSPDRRSLSFHFNASLSLLNLVKTKDYLKHNKKRSNTLSVVSYKHSFFNKSFIERFFPRSLFPQTLQKYDDTYRQALNYGVIQK